MKNQGVISIDGWQIDADSNRLARNGVYKKLEPRSMELLLYFTEHPDQVVSRREIEDSVWKDRVVGYEALSVAVGKIRKAFEDNGKQHRVIETIPKQGYRLIAPVLKVVSAPGLFRYELPDKPSIAVLPFKNLSDDPGQDFMADGMSEEIITALSRVPDLIVISRTSTFVYKQRTVDVQQIGRELAVKHVLEGSIRKSGERLRITAQLVDTLSGDHIWAEHYDRKLDDIFAVQDEITHRIVIELQVQLVTGEYSRRWASGTESIEAWELVIRANPLLEALVRDKNMAAQQMLNRALEIDNQYCIAWAMMGWAYWQESAWEWSADPEKSMQQAFEAAKKALAINPQYPDGLSLLGHVYFSRDDTEQAMAMCERAAELAPGDSETLSLLGTVLVLNDHVKRGIQKIQTAIRLNPFPPAWYLSILGAGHHLDGDSETAISLLRQAAEREPGSILHRTWLANVMVETGRLEEAATVAKAILSIDPTFTAISWSKGVGSRLSHRFTANLVAAGIPE